MVTLRGSLRRTVAAGSFECGACGSCGLLDGTTVVILVTVQSGTTSERLLAISVRALIRTLARVRSAMPRQRAAVTESLIVVSILSKAVKGRVLYLGADFAAMGLLASVHSLVHGESRPLDELLAAGGMVANVRPVTAVDAFCYCQSGIGTAKGVSNTYRDEPSPSGVRMAFRMFYRGSSSQPAWGTSVVLGECVAS